MITTRGRRFVTSYFSAPIPSWIKPVLFYKSYKSAFRDEMEMYWVEFTAIFNKKKKKKNRFLHILLYSMLILLISMKMKINKVSPDWHFCLKLSCSFIDIIE